MGSAKRPKMANQFFFSQQWSDTGPNSEQGGRQGQFRQSRNFSQRSTIRGNNRHSINGGARVRVKVLFS
jgi:hypothetical protein